MFTFLDMISLLKCYQDPKLLSNSHFTLSAIENNGSLSYNLKRDFHYRIVGYAIENTVFHFQRYKFSSLPLVPLLAPQEV